MYEHQLAKRPLFTKCWMSGVILGIADCIAQHVQHKEHKKHNKQCLQNARSPPVQQQRKEGDNAWKRDGSTEGWYNWRRAGAVQVYSYLFQGPFGHMWYPFLDRSVGVLTAGNPMLKIPMKIMFDECVNGILSTTLYFSTIPMMEGKTLGWIQEKLRWDLLATFCIEIIIWVPSSAINFAFVPVRHQLFYCNGVLLVWTTFMSLVCHDESLLRLFDPYNPFLTLEEKKRYAQQEHAATLFTA